MFVIIVGGGKTGSQLAESLLFEGYEVKIIEPRSDVLERLARELPAEIILAGDGSAPSVLEAAGIQRANVLAAVTSEDETNLVITTLAKFESTTPRTPGFTRPRWGWMWP